MVAAAAACRVKMKNTHRCTRPYSAQTALHMGMGYQNTMLKCTHTHHFGKKGLEIQWQQPRFAQVPLAPAQQE